MRVVTRSDMDGLVCAVLLKEVENKSIYLEEYCRTMIAQEESDYIEMKKLLRDHKK